MEFLVNITDGSGGSVFYDKKESVRVVVGITCFLSMLGSVLVVLSFACFSSFRTHGRFILFNLALMDFGIGLGNLVGAIVDFDHYYYDRNHSRLHPGRSAEDCCKAQAFLSHYCTNSSILWTINLAVYLYMLIDLDMRQHRAARYYLPLSTVLCYALPLGLTLWLLLTERLGHAPINAAAWCSIIINKSPTQYDYIAATIGYDLWIYLAMVVCLVVYPALFLQLNFLHEQGRELIGNKKYWKKAIEFLDFKLLLIPVLFILLRVWSCISNILYTYLQLSQVPKSVSVALIYLSGIGDSGQGLANGLLFVVLTKSIRHKMLKRCTCRTIPNIGNDSISSKDRTHLLEDSNSHNYTPNNSQSIHTDN